MAREGQEAVRSRPVPEVAPTAPAPSHSTPPVAMPEPAFGDGNGAAYGDTNGHGDLDGPDRLFESHAPAPSADEPGGPTVE